MDILLDIFGLSPYNAEVFVGNIYPAIIICFILFLMCGVCFLANGNFAAGIIGLLIAGGLFLSIPVVIQYHEDLDAMRPHFHAVAYSFNTSENIPIWSLDEGTGYSLGGNGRFILGTGSFDVGGKSTDYYTYYKVIGTDEYMWDKTEKEGIIVKEDGNENPRVEIIRHISVSQRTSYTDNGQIYGGVESVTGTTKYIHVPKGTIIKEIPSLSHV